VLVVQQIRMGPLAKGDPNPWLIEPVAGLIDAGESAESTALRELREEAGLGVQASALRRVGTYYPSPGAIAQVLTSYVALCDLPDGEGGLHGVDDEGEDIRTHVLSFDALMALIASGEAADAPLIVSAQWLALNRATLRSGG
jgi:nudix-type nucleoside diphosphatase (YffH/AdpP family)